MVRSHLPSPVRGHPHAAALFVGCAAASVVTGLSGAFAWLAGSGRFPPAIVLFDLAVAAACAAFAIAIGRGLISTARGLELSASSALCALYCVTLAEMVGVPSRAVPLTARCCLILVVAGVAIRSRGVLMSLAAGAVLSWTAVAFVVPAASFDPSQWWSTWVITVAVAFATQLITSAERGVEQRVRHDAQNSSLRDPLTGLANRRGLLQLARPILSLAQRSGQPVWCAFIDVDHFKSVNDPLGHEVGDAVLVAVSHALRSAARESDVPARWGGDEFVLLGIGPPPDGRGLEQRIVGQLRQLLSGITELWSVSVTVGSAVRGADRDGATVAIAALVGEADRCMYERRKHNRPAPVKT